jgi:hypothetical protein
MQSSTVFQRGLPTKSRHMRLPDELNPPDTSHAGKADASLSAMFGPPEKAAPWWVLPVLAFIVGVAVTAALLKPAVATPDYQRGHKEGFAMGQKNEAAKVRADLALAFEEGVREGRKLAAAGK